MKGKLFFIVLLSCLMLNSYASNDKGEKKETVTQLKIMDDFNNPLPGAMIINKTTNDIIYADFDGNVNIPSSAISNQFEVSYPSFHPEVFSLSDKAYNNKSISIRLISR